MKTCEHCNVTILASRTACPLCAAPLRAGEEPAREVYPYIPMVYKHYSFFFRLLIFISVSVGSISVYINLYFRQGGWWSAIVLAGIAYMWITIVYGVRRLHRIGRAILYQLVALSAVAFVVDVLYGNGWATDYVIPVLCVSALGAITVVATVSRKDIEDFAIYIVVSGLLGIVPLIFVLTGIVSVYWPSLACVLLSILSLAGVLIVGGRDMLQELVKRFHL